MIKKLIIENFRSIKFAEINLTNLNAFIGPNNAGKSNIMKALALVLGDVYPSPRSFDNKDFYNYDCKKPIKIEVRFDSPLSCNNNVYGFQLTFDGENCEYFAIDNNGCVLTYDSRKEIRVSNDMKSEVVLMYLGLNRQASQQVRATQWTLYGKLLKHIENKIDPNKKQTFKSSIENSYKTNIHSYLQQMEDILKKHIKEQTGLDLILHLSIFDPIDVISNLRPQLKESTSQNWFDAEDMGAGTQSALAIAIARAYAEIVKQPLVMAIEEPELYLHPHGCRHFYKLLNELSNKGVQIIYTTHERSFVDVSNYQNIHLVRKESNETKIYSGAEKQISSDEINAVSKFDEGINEVFFAKQVVLVEGPDDKIACKLALENLGVQLDKECISIAECGGNTAIKQISEVIKIFNIPCFVLLDEDPGNKCTQQIINELKNSIGDEYVLLQSPNLEGMFDLPNKLNKAEAIKYFPDHFRTKQVPQVYEDLKNKLKS